LQRLHDWSQRPIRQRGFDVASRQSRRTVAASTAAMQSFSTM
jgi:hypothetical protein